ncbi:MAG: hypothetical protein WCF18_18730 [Chthoniobacteraceae bacterium]
MPNLDTRTIWRTSLLALTITLASASLPAQSAPTLNLVKAGTSAAVADSIQLGTATYALDLKLDTGGDPVSGLQFYLTSNDPTVHFGLTPVVALNQPFIDADILIAPNSGSLVNQSQGTSVLFKADPGDYPAFASRAILSFTFDTSTLPAGDYLFTPVGQELTFTGTTRTAFAAPGLFSLKVQAIPEPSTMFWGVLIFGTTGFLRGRRESAPKQ